MRSPQRDGLGDPKPVSEHHQKQEVIANAVAARLGGYEQPVDLRLSEIVAAAFVRIRGAIRFTFYILPVGHVFDPSLHLNRHWVLAVRTRHTLYTMHTL